MLKTIQPSFFVLAATSILSACVGSSNEDSPEKVSSQLEAIPNTQVGNLIRDGAPFAGAVTVAAEGRLGELTVSGGEMPVNVYRAEPKTLYREEGFDGDMLALDGSEAIGDAYFLPWHPGEATIMTLPDHGGAAPTFVTSRLTGCAVAVGENANGQAVVMHLNFVKTQAIVNQEQTVQSALDALPRDNPPGNAVASYNQARTSFTNATSQQYTEAVDSAVRLGFFREAPQVILPNDYQLGSVSPDGLIIPREAFVTGTLGNNGWTFRYSAGLEFPTHVEPTSIEENLGGNAPVNEDVEPFPQDDQESQVDWYDARQGEEDAHEAFEDAVEALEDLESLSEQEQGVRIYEALEVVEELDRIFSGRPLPQSLASERTALLGELDSLGVDYGTTTSDQITQDFYDVADSGSDLATVLAEGGAVHRGFIYAGRAFLVIGIGISVYRVVTAENHALQAAKEAGGWAAAIAAGSAAAGSLSWLDCLGPYGWIADGAVALGAGALGFWAGSNAVQFAYDTVHPDNTDPLPDILRRLRVMQTLPAPYFGHSDGLLFQRTDGQVFFASLNNAAPHGGAYIFRPVGSSWSLKGIGDVDGDRTDDIIWQNDSGQVHYWQMQDGVLQRGVSVHTPVGSSWSLRGVGDVNGDGTDDIIWQHSSGQVHYWPMQNGVRQGGFNIYTPISSSWSLRGVGDVNGDGTDDIVWQHSSGQVHYWPMQNGVRQGGFDIYIPVGNDWSLNDIGDINGDGTDDIVWQHNSGQIHYWPMQDGVRQAGFNIGSPVSSEWRLRAAGDVYGPHVVRGHESDVPQILSGPQYGSYRHDCYAGPNTFDEAPCDVFVYGGVNYWAYTHGSNSTILLIAAFSPDGDLLGVIERRGARYPWRAELNLAGDAVTWRGQSDRKVTIQLTDLPGQP